MHLLLVAGARPNFMKVAPILRAARAAGHRATLVHTGQHYDHQMSAAFFADLGMPDPEYHLGVGSGSHAVQTARVMESFEPVLLEAAADWMVVVGDVNSTLACSLVATKKRVPVAHVEAGLRSFDRSMPEEVNRVLTDQVAELLFTHSPDAAANLAAEGIAGDRVHLVGNTMIDSLVALEGRFRERRACDRHGLEPGTYLLVTLHRPALVDGPLLDTAIAALASVSESMPVLFPVHPRTWAALGEGAGGLPPGLRLIDPIGYLDFLSLEADAGAVLTDSGGIQEETTYLGVPCFTLRANTERPITIEHGTNHLLGLEPERIVDVPELVAAAPARPEEPPPLWDGHAAERLARVVADRHGG